MKYTLYSNYCGWINEEDIKQELIDCGRVECEEEKEQLRQLEIAKVRKVLEMLKPVQRERLIKAILLGMSSRKIAKEEGVYYSVVDKSIAAARKNFKKFYENL